MARGVPGYSADSGKVLGGWEGLWRGEGGGHTYVWEPGPRAAGSWYVWTLRVGKRAAKRSLAIGRRGWGGAIVRAKRGRGDGEMPRIWIASRNCLRCSK